METISELTLFEWKAYTVDNFAPYHIDNTSHHKAMNSALQNGMARKFFSKNIGNFGVRENIYLLKGDSRIVLPSLDSKSFDFIYIDGSHQYPNVKSDLSNAGRLLKDDGYLVGDDLETLEVPNLYDHFKSIQDCLDFAAGYHPGVTQAVLEEIGASNLWHDSGIYLSKMVNSSFTKPKLPPILNFDLAMKLIPYFIHIPNVAHIVEESDTFNLVLTNQGIFKIKHSLGPLTQKQINNRGYRIRHGITLESTRKKYFLNQLLILLKNLEFF